MKKLICLSFLLLSSLALKAQDSTQTKTPETFEYNWEGEDYTMQKYFIVFLKEGPNRSQDEKEAAKIQQEHLAYLGNLYQKEIIVLNGPSQGDEVIKGFSLYAVATKEDAIAEATRFGLTIPDNEFVHKEKKKGRPKKAKPESTDTLSNIINGILLESDGISSSSDSDAASIKASTIGPIGCQLLEALLAS